MNNDLITPSASPSSMASFMDDHPTTIKMEDLQQMSPEPMSSKPLASDTKPAKKRKSWGQVLPEPKTNLPPRKRAKTADEKEQRRIERVKRNRLAAHNSRERKRQEVEGLQQEKDNLEMQLQIIREHMSKMANEIRTYRQMVPGAPIEGQAAVDLDHMDDMFANISNSNATINPRQASFPSPDSMLDSMDSPFDTASQPSTPMDELTVNEPEPTQHSAVSVGYQQSSALPIDFNNKPLQFDDNLPPTFQSTSLNDDSFDNFFDLTSIVEDNHDSFFTSSFSNTATMGNPFSTANYADQFTSKLFDLHADSGATPFVSDEPGVAAEF